MEDYTKVYNVQITEGIYKGEYGVYYKNGTPVKKYSYVCLNETSRDGVDEITISEEYLKFIDNKSKEEKKDESSVIKVDLVESKWNVEREDLSQILPNENLNDQLIIVVDWKNKRIF